MDSKQTEQKLFDEPKKRVEEGYIWTPEKGLQKNIKQPLKPKPTEQAAVPEDLKERYDYAVAIMRNMDEHWELKEGNEVIYAQYQRDIADIERIAALQTDLQRLQSAKDASEQEWTTWGVVEIAVRNPNVASYMEHWEGRATKAEAELQKRTKNADFLRDMVGACHLAISRNDLNELRQKEWEPVDLPPRLYKFIQAQLGRRQEEIERLKAPVSDEEGIAHGGLRKDGTGPWIMTRTQIDRLIAARAQAKPDAAKEEKA